MRVLEHLFSRKGDDSTCDVCLLLNLGLLTEERARIVDHPYMYRPGDSVPGCRPRAKFRPAFSIKARVTQSSTGCVRSRFAPRREAFRFARLLIGVPFHGTLQRLSKVGGVAYVAVHLHVIYCLASIFG